MARSARTTRGTARRKSSAQHRFKKEFVTHAETLYADYLDARFEPARHQLCLALKSLLDHKFNPTDRRYLRVEMGRVKGFNELLAKASKDEWREKMRKPEDLFKIEDIVGTRITCNVLSDVECVRRAIESVEVDAGKGEPPFRISRRLKTRDYIIAPKKSGYRAIHVFVEVAVPSGARMRRVTCEIQVRSLLQDAWGELTHADTYKPGMVVPEIVVNLSTRLATALAVMDEIAQDIRKELDSAMAPFLPEARPRRTPKAKSAAATVKPSDEALLSELYELSHPYLGHVVYTGVDYALVQLPPGRTGILHWSQMGTPGFVDMSSRFSVGETVSVCPSLIDDAKQRLELKPAASGEL